jgi:hypothetical protein
VPSGVEPKIARLSNGLLVVASGRPGLYVWVGEDPSTEQPTALSTDDSTDHSTNLRPGAIVWQGFNIAAHHNEAYPDSSLHFKSTSPATSETTSYTGMVVVPNEDAVIVSYDRLGNGWSPAPFPPSAGGLSAIFAVKIKIDRTGPAGGRSA